jgi:phenylacetate-CoA ligase
MIGPLFMNDFLKYYFKNNFLTSKKINAISELYELSFDKLLSLYNDRFINLFKYAYKYSSFYKNIYQSNGISMNDVKDLLDIAKLPIITKTDVRNNTNSINQGVRLFQSIGYTSGTTGSPLNIYRSPFNVITEQAYLSNYRSILGYTIGSPLISIRGALGKNSTYKFNKFSNILYISSHNINSNTIVFYYNLIKNFSPVGVEAFPSLLYKFCFELNKKGLKLNIPISFTSSETLYDFQREFVESYLNTHIYDWYGNGERTICLAQDFTNKYYPLPLYSINEYFSENIVTTSLTNNVFPLIRYQVDDIVKLNESDFYKNIVSPDIHSIQGRAGVNIDLKDGSSVACIDHSFKGIAFLEMAQVHQYSIDAPLEIKLVVSKGFNNSHLNLFKSKFSTMVGFDTDFFITYSKMEDLTYSSNNKFSLVIKHFK